MFACIYVPDFPVEAILRVEPWLRQQAVAVLEGKAPLMRVVALNEKARCLGMEVGMTKLQAAFFSAPAKEVAHSTEPKTRTFKTTLTKFSSRRSKSKPKPGMAILRQRSAGQENSVHAALLDVAHAFTPRVEDTANDTVLLDLAGLERLYGAPASMARDLASRVNAIGWRQTSRWRQILKLPCMLHGDSAELLSSPLEKKPIAWEFCRCKCCWMHSISR